MNERDLLLALAQGAVSGAALARRFGITRAAVWKRVQSLRAAGIAIQANARQGYVLAQNVDLLDAATIRAALGVQAQAEVMQLEVDWSIDSTNATLLRRDAPARGSLVLLAEHQTAGRGRRGRFWTSPLTANLYLSASRRYACGLAPLGGLGLAAGVAVVEALQDLGVVDVALKWPNDIVVDGCKLGGVLVQGSGESAGAARAVIGLGLNVRMPSSLANTIEQPWIDLAAVLPHAPSRNVLSAHVLDHLLPACALFDQAGLAPFLQRYATHDALRDRMVAVYAREAQHHGRALGVAEDGALRVEISGAEQRFYAGEVSVRTP